jgi:hypothetical protein
MKHHFFIIAFAGFLLSGSTIVAQFAPPVGQAGTTAMYKDSSAFLSWATGCNVIRGLQDISTPGTGYANVGDSASVFGIAGTTGVVSLGDGGQAIVKFALPVIDQQGPDFAVFENGFDDTFLELAFVEVSSDGAIFFRIPAVSNTDTTMQTNSFGSTDATLIHNLAGKYRGNYGTPFDLADIPDNLLLNKQGITHIKIIDVVGCIQNQYCSKDANNHKVNDPWPTAFGSSGFDLDAVGVIHQQSVGVNELELAHLAVYPNPATDVLFVNVPRANYSITVTNIIGEIVLQSENRSYASSLPLHELQQGVYVLTVISNVTQKQVKFVKQ